MKNILTPKWLRLPLLALITVIPHTHLSAATAKDEVTRYSPPLGSFNFDFERLGKTEVKQIKQLQKIGYTGMAMRVNSAEEIRSFDRYRKAIQNTDFKIYAGFVAAKLGKGPLTLHPQLGAILKRLKSVDAKLWVIIREDAPLKRNQVLRVLKGAADQAKAAGVELVIYPHDNTFIESAEDALSYIKQLKHDNLFVSLHLCHEIRAGNGERLKEVAAEIKPYIRLASINGADKKYIDNTLDWSRTIQPLGSGDYDASKLLQALSSIDYSGPVILHTFGLQKAPAHHHHSSYKHYQSMLR